MHEDAVTLFDSLVGAFEDSYSRLVASGGGELVIAVGPCLICLRCTSGLLLQRLRRPLSHLVVVAPPHPPDVTIDLIDASGTNMPMPLFPQAPQATSPEQDTREYRQGSYLITGHGDILLTALNEEQSRTVGIVADPANWPLEHYKQAIFITLYQHLRRRRLYLVHASAVALQDRALLIAGSSGAGKTTTMLSCVQSGFHFLGDDTTLVQPLGEGQFRVISVLNTVNLTESTLDWFPEARPYVSTAQTPLGKRLLFVPELYPKRIQRWCNLHAIVVPTVTTHPQTRLVPASKASMLTDMLYYSLDLHDTDAAREHLEVLASLMETTPGYRLLLGHHQEQIPTILRELLFVETPSSPPGR